MDCDRLLHQMQEAIERAQRARHFALIQLELAREMVAESKQAVIRAQAQLHAAFSKIERSKTTTRHRFIRVA